MENLTNRIIFHHTANASRTSQLEQVNVYHRTKFNWLSSLGYFVAYHYFIDTDGTVTNCRAEKEGAPDELGHNFDGISVCMAGNFDMSTPTPEQEAAFASLAIQIMARNSIPLNMIQPHRFFRQTSCPGYLIPDTWGSLAVANAQLSRIKLLFYKLKIALGL